MKAFCGLILFVFILSCSNSENLVRKKRFFNTLWPSEEVKKDVQNGYIYAQLPPEYLHLLPGVNDHKTMQRRSGQQQPVRFVHPTRMAVLMQPLPQPKPMAAQPPKVSPPVNTKPPAVGPTNQQQFPRIVMKPVVQNPKFRPSIALQTNDETLPDIHKTQRFIPLRPASSPTQKPLVQPFNTHQALPIKKSFDKSPALISVTSADIKDFYYTKEFQDLLAAFGIKADKAKLPPISDVMAILGTENGEETLRAIREITESAEGMEIIKSYLDQNGTDEEFYNYDEDVGAGEIKVSGTEGVKYAQQPQPTYGTPVQANPQLVYSPPRATTTGTLTGQSWWRPSTWFTSSPSTKVESLQKDAEILKNVVPKPDSAWESLSYIGKFLSPSSSESVPISPPFNVQPIPRRIFQQQPLRFSHQSVIEDTKTLPAVQMTEAQFQDMVKTLKLTPINAQHLQKPNSLQIPKETTAAPLDKFQAPINVQSVSTGISQDNLPLPSTYTQIDNQKPKEPQPSLELPNETSNLENRRNFVSPSEPQRSAPYDFIATGKIHKANPEAVIKKSKSLAETVEEEKQVVASISELNQHHNNQER